MLCYLFDFYPAYSQNTLNVIDGFLEDVTFQDNTGKTLTMQAISGLKNDKIAYFHIINNGLAEYKNRKESYIRVLRAISIQPDFHSLDLALHLKESHQANTQALAEVLSVVLPVSDATPQVSKYISTFKFLKYTKNTGELSSFLNSLKSNLRTIRASDFKHFSETLSILNIGVSSYNAYQNFDEAFNSYVLIKALELDLALQRLEFVRNHYKGSDKAVIEAIDSVSIEIKSVPGDFWKQIIETWRLESDKIIKGGTAASDVGIEVFKLCAHSAKLITAAAWLGAVFFAGEQIWLIIDWNHDFRDACTLATLYTQIESSLANKKIKTEFETSFLEYLQYFYLQMQINTLGNAYFYIIEGSINAFEKIVHSLFPMYIPKIAEARAEPRKIFNIVLDGLTESIVNRRLNHIFKEEQKPVSTGDINIGLILDSSGSMRENDPADIRKSATKLIIDRLGQNNKIFLVEFDDHSIWLNQDSHENWNADQLKTLVDHIDSEGGTNIGGGLDRMKDALSTAIKSGEVTSVLLLTDGLGNYKDEAEWYKQNQIPIYTISLVGNENSVLLNSIAAETGGEYMKAATAEDIFNTFNRFFSKLSGTNTVCSYTDHISQDQKLDYSFIIDPGMDEYNAYCAWAGSRISLTLTDPHGRTYLSKKGGVNWAIGDNYISLKFKKPDAGVWHVSFLGEEIPSGGEDFIFEVTGESPIKLDFGKLGSINALIRLTITFNLSSKKINVKEANIYVLTPKNEKIDISKTYQNDILDYRPQAGKGNYRFIMNLKGDDEQGNPFQRVLTKTVLFGEDAMLSAITIQKILGNFITVNIGKNQGNRTGITCLIYDNSGSGQPLAKGYVTYVVDDECRIEIQQYLRPGKAQVGYVVELNLQQWSKDKP